MIRDIDVRSVLPAIHVPTLVIRRLQDRITPPRHGRYLASHIADARYLEQPGDHSLRFAGSGDIDALCAEISDFLSGQAGKAEPDRALAAVVVIDTGQDVAEARRQVSCHRGRRPAEILVSRTVMDLTAGAGHEFADRGTHQFAGIAGVWPVLALIRSGHSRRPQ